MEALRDTARIVLVLVGVLSAIALVVLTWPAAVLVAVFAAVTVAILEIVKIVVDGRFRDR